VAGKGEQSNESENMKFYYLPRLIASPLLCLACRDLVLGDWYEEIRHHGSLGALYRSSLTCHLCLLAYQKIYGIAAILVKNARRFLEVTAETARSTQQRIPDVRMDVILGQRRPESHSSGYDVFQAFYPRDISFSMQSRNIDQRNRAAGMFGVDFSVYPKATFNLRTLSGMRFLYPPD
jgi:hypothetical protein